MTGKSEMMGVLLEACPSFIPTWQDFQEEWQEQADDLPLYLVLSDFARHLVGMLERCEMANLHAAFLAIEHLHVVGDSYVREAATVGLLEDLQNTNLHPNGTNPEQFRQYLGPESARWWDKLYRFWDRGELLTDD